MSYANPTGEERPVPLDLAAKHVLILRSHLTDWLHGAREDLKAPRALAAPRPGTPRKPRRSSACWWR